MDDKPNKEEPKKDFNKLDLTQLGSFSFGTQWSQEKPQSGGAGQRPQGDRPRRDGPRDDRKDRRGFKRPGGPGREGGPGGRPGSGDRPQGGDRPSGGERGPGGGQGQPRGRGRDTRAPFRGDSRREGGYNQAPVGPYVSPYFDATFYPEDVSFDALAKTIRASCRTFELFDIAKTVIAKNDRFVVVLERKPAKDPAAPKRPFYVSVPDSVPFETEEEAVNHVMTKHLGRFFSSEQVETDPPKGSFQVINKCGVTGELLGPPNYHLYNQSVQQHHATHLPRMPFDAFKNRIESVREPEVIEAWLELMKKVTRYTWIGGDKPAATVAPTEESAPATEVEVDASAEAEVPAAESEAVDSETPAPAPVADESITFDSLAEAKVFLLTKVRDKVVRAYEHGRFHGRELENMPDSEIKRAVIGALERQQRFPLDSANALRGRLRREGFTIFKKGSKGVSFVCAVKRKFRVPGQTFADSIDQLITFIETHPMVKVSSLAEKFLKISTVKEEEKKPVAPVTEEPATEAEAPVAAPAPSEAAPATPEPTKAIEPETVEISAADQARIKRMNLDLRWLVTEGYVTEFIDGSLFAAAPIPPAKPKPAPKPKAEVEAAPAPAAETTEVAETPAEASSAPAEETPEAPSEAATIATEPTAPAEPVEPAEPATEVAPKSEAPDTEVASETTEPRVDAPAKPDEPPATAETEEKKPTE